MEQQWEGTAMLIFGVTTTHKVCSLALWRDGLVLAEDTFDGKRTCLEELTPRIETMFHAQGLDYRDVDLYAGDRGPGGLTGIKIGLVTVRTLAQIADKPTASCSALRVLACAVPPSQPIIMSVTRCSPREVYFAFFRGGRDLPERMSEDVLATVEQAADNAAKFLEQDVLLIGNGSELVAEQCGNSSKVADKSLWAPHARHVCRLAARAAHQPWRALQANYLCITYAEHLFASRKAGA